VRKRPNKFAMNAPTTLVTGAAGFVGSHLAESLLRRGHNVVAVDDMSGGFDINVPGRCHFIRASVCDEEAVAAIFRKYSFDYVYHAAAYAAEGLSHFIRRHNYRNNVIGSVNLINESVNNKVKCFVFFSSIAVYGKGQLPMTEDMRPHPEDPYGIGKFAVEMDLEAAHAMFGLPYVVFRPHNVYGERQNLNDRFRNVVGIFCRQLLKGEPLSVFGDGSQRRAFTYVGDISDILARAAETPEAYGQAFNIGADQPTSVLELARLLTQVSGRDTGIVHLPPRLEVVDAFSSHEKLERVFGPMPKTALSEGLAKTWQWASGEQVKPYHLDFQIEVQKNMPLSWR
jgi:UDP-glucose 4-epimerase